MPLKIKCPTCKRVLSVPVQRIGAIVRCPVCEKKLRVPKPQQAKSKKPGPSEKGSPPTRGKSPPADAPRKPRPAAENPPRVEREPAPPPEPKRRPDRPKKPAPKKMTSEERPPAPPEPPPVSKAVSPKRGSPKREPKKPEPLDPPKPPPLSKSKQKRAQDTPDSSPAEHPTEEPKPEEAQARQEPDEGVAKTRAKENRWRREHDGHPVPERPPLPRKAQERKKAKDDSRADTRAEPPPVPSRVHREERPAETSETEAQEPEREVVRGYEHDVQRRWTVYYLGIALILTAFFGAIPAIMDIIQHFRTIDSPGVSRWALALLLASGIQLAYAVYLMQLPDWGTAWVVSLVTLVMATAYAMFLGIAILAKEDNLIIQLLGLAGSGYGKKAAGWCLIMLSISSLLAYFSGRISVRWRQAYEMLTTTSPEQ